LIDWIIIRFIIGIIIIMIIIMESIILGEGGITDGKQLSSTPIIVD
jgi:hypothetical protein